MRAQSIATLPFPITTARSCERSNSSSWKSGWPLYQATNCGRGPRAGQVLAGDAEPPVGLRADRVDDRVVEPQQLVVRDVAADLDVAEEAEARAARAVFSNARETALMFSWSGATPRRTRPHGVGSRSIRSTSTGGSLALQQRVGRVEPGRARSRRRRRGEASSSRVSASQRVSGAAGAAAGAPSGASPSATWKLGRSRTQRRRSGSRS